MDTYSQTINMGVYISDLAYITLFDQQEESLDYFEAIHYLSEAIRISSAFEDPLLNRISENIDNVDSLVVIAGEAYQDIVDYLVDNEMENKLSLLSVSAFVESLYVTLSYIDKYEADNEIIKKLVDQKNWRIYCFFIPKSIWVFNRRQCKMSKVLLLFVKT